MRNRLSTLLALLLFAVSASAQLPAPVGNARYDESNAFVFRDNELTTVHLTMAPADLDAMLASPWNDVEYPCAVHFANAVTNEDVANVTINVRGNTSRGARKKSFALSFNNIVKGTRFHGIKKLNLIGAQNDVSIVRTKLALDVLRGFGLPSQRTVLVHFSINDGARVDDIYIGTEQINDDFLKAWFGNDAGNLYKGSYEGARADLRYIEPGDAATYQVLGTGPTYEEKNNDDHPDFTDLADFIRFVNKSTDAEFAQGLPGRFNVDGFLRNLAADIALGQWDNIWYGANNWYLYHNPNTARFEWIPYDYDNPFGVDFFGIDWASRPYDGWGSGGFGSNPDVSPLVRRVLAVPDWEAQLRRYIHALVGSVPAAVPVHYPDAAGDTFLGQTAPHFDIVGVDVGNDAANVTFTVRVAGPITAGGDTDQARFMIFLDTGDGGRTSNPWSRDINSTAPSDEFIGAWTDGGGGFLAYRAEASGWKQVYSSGGNAGGVALDLGRASEGVLHLTVPRAFLGLSSSGAFTFDVVTTNDRHQGTEPGVDHLSNAAPATTGYDTPSTPGAFLSYTLRDVTRPSGHPPFSLGVLGPRIDTLKALAAPFAYRGPTSGDGMDYGWTAADFDASFDAPATYRNPGRPWNWGLKPYIQARAQSLLLTVPEPPPLPRRWEDAVAALRVAGGVSGPPPVSPSLDADGNGSVDTLDAVVILRSVADVD
jgi:hypothetical protein